MGKNERNEINCSGVMLTVTKVSKRKYEEEIEVASLAGRSRIYKASIVEGKKNNTVYCPMFAAGKCYAVEQLGISLYGVDQVGSSAHGITECKYLKSES